MTVTAKFHNLSLSRRTEWQQVTRLYRDTKQFCIDGWENSEFNKSVTTASIDNGLYSAIQKPFGRRNPTTARGGSLPREPTVRCQQPELRNRHDRERHGRRWLPIRLSMDTPIEVSDDIADPVDRLLEGDVDKSLRQGYDRGDDCDCPFNIESDADTSGETPIGSVSILVNGTSSLQVRMARASRCWCLVVRRSPFNPNIVPYAIRSRKRASRTQAGEKEQRRIKDLNHPLLSPHHARGTVRGPRHSDGRPRIHKNSSWSGVYS